MGPVIKMKNKEKEIEMLEKKIDKYNILIRETSDLLDKRRLELQCAYASHLVWKLEKNINGWVYIHCETCGADITDIGELQLMIAKIEEDKIVPF